MILALESALIELRNKLLETEPYTVEVSMEVDAITKEIENLDD